MDFIYQLEGVTKEAGHIAVTFFNEDGEIEFTPAALHVDGKLGLSTTIFGDDFTFLQQTATRAVPKLTIPSPSMVHYRGGKAAVDPRVYPDLEQFWADLVAAYREEVRRLGELGCTYLQLDDTSLAYMNDPHQRDYIASIGGDHERQHLEYIRHINEALADRPAGMSVTTHACRGNFRSAWAAEGSWDFVAEALLNELEVDGFFMEWDDERSGGFEPLRFLPPRRQAGRARAGHDEARRARVAGRAPAAHRGGVEARSAGAALPLAAMRLLVDGRRKRADGGGAVGEAAAGRRGRRGGLGLRARPARSPAAGAGRAATRSRAGPRLSSASAGTTCSKRLAPRVVGRQFAAHVSPVDRLAEHSRLPERERLEPRQRFDVPAASRSRSARPVRCAWESLPSR